MSQRPASLEEVWREDELCEKLGLPVTASGRSRQLSNWIRGGLKYIIKSGRRYFIESDVLDYLWSRHPDTQ